MSKRVAKIKGFRVPEVEKRPLSNKFTTSINAGMASAGPPLGPLLGKYGINISGFCKTFNDKTKNYVKGIPLPCTICINPDRSYNIAIETPSMDYYLIQAAGVTSSFRENGEIIGKITLKHVYEIAKIKHEDPHSYFQLDDLQELCEKIIDLARSLGIQVVRNLDPVEYQQFLRERKETLEKRLAEIAAEKEAKLLRQ